MSAQTDGWLCPVALNKQALPEKSECISAELPDNEKCMNKINQKMKCGIDLGLKSSIRNRSTNLLLPTALSPKRIILKTSKHTSRREKL